MRKNATAIGRTALLILPGVLLFAACAADMQDDAPAASRQTAAASQSDARGRDARAAEPPATSGAIIWADPIEVARGNAVRGPWRMNRSNFDFVDDGTVAINDAGYVGVAWANHPKQDILFQLYSPQGEPLLDEPTNISRSGRIFSWLPRIILTDADSLEEITVYALWQEIVFSGGSHGGEIFFAHSTDGGRAFSEPRNLSNTTAGAGKGRLTSSQWHNGSLDIARGNDGTLCAAWTEYEGNLWFARSTDNGETFSEPRHIFGDEFTLSARGPTLAMSDNGTIYLAWTVGETQSANIHFTMSSDGGRTFTEPRTLHQREGHADAPKLTVDGKGALHLVFAESAAGPFRDYRLFYSRATGREHAFSEPREIAAAHRDRYESIHFPMLRIDGDDNLYVSWELFPNVRGRSFGLGFTFSTDGGRTFASPQVIPGTDDRNLGFNGSQQGLLMSKLAVNRRGEVAAVNSSFRPDTSSRIRLYRGRLMEVEPAEATGDEAGRAPAGEDIDGAAR